MEGSAPEEKERRQRTRAKETRVKACYRERGERNNKRTFGNEVANQIGIVVHDATIVKHGISFRLQKP
jgi:hypothetical protein